MKTMRLAAMMLLAGTTAAQATEPSACTTATQPRLICTDMGCVRLTADQMCELAGARSRRPAKLMPVNMEERGRTQLTKLIATLD